MSESHATPDRISIMGLRGTGHHGVFDFEKADGQEFVVDVALDVDMRAAAASDDLADTVDYGAVSERVHAVITGEPVNLIETLAQRIADTCLAEPGVLRVKIVVHKPSAPISVPFDDVTVEVVRSRESLA